MEGLTLLKFFYLNNKSFFLKFKNIFYIILFINFIFLIYLINSNVNNLHLEIFTLSSMPSHLSKNNKDIEIPKTISYNNNTDSLSQFIQDALVGEFLGDGSLQFNKKDQEGKPKPNTNAYLSITLKSMFKSLGSLVSYPLYRSSVCPRCYSLFGSSGIRSHICCWF